MILTFKNSDYKWIIVFCFKFIPSRSHIEQILSQQNSLQDPIFREPTPQERTLQSILQQHQLFQNSSPQVMLTNPRQNAIVALPVNRHVGNLTSLQLQQAGMEIVYGEVWKRSISKG